ncbi:MAG: hypothetical protein JJU46_09695 [Balneolaceae bacterium]|nr:hypothetical protein [Balneolaceae bacterium]MCH8547860.1 hypothetical protein [Balneolaceae bacterium]
MSEKELKKRIKKLSTEAQQEAAESSESLSLKSISKNRLTPAHLKRNPF